MLMPNVARRRSATPVTTTLGARPHSTETWPLVTPCNQDRSCSCPDGAGVKSQGDASVDAPSAGWDAEERVTEYDSLRSKTESEREWDEIPAELLSSERVMDARFHERIEATEPKGVSSTGVEAQV